MKYLLILLSLLILVGCKTTIVPPEKVETTTTITTTEVVHDTIFKIQADSSAYRALLECRENKVVIKTPPKSSKGNYLEEPTVSITDNLLAVDCDAKAKELLAKWKAKHITTEKASIITKYIEVERKLNWWQRWHIRLGKLFILLMVGGVVYGIFKLKNIFL